MNSFSRIGAKAGEIENLKSQRGSLNYKFSPLFTFSEIAKEVHSIHGRQRRHTPSEIGMREQVLIEVSVAVLLTGSFLAVK
jgi:hypothetical protein